jgi:quercetin dioxygenase-like cupin family protein
MRRTRLFLAVGVATLCGTGVALATHVPQVDPATVPTGFLATHNQVENIRISSLARAVDDRRADVFVQHIRFSAGQDTGWHSHPGPVFVEVVGGSLIYQDTTHGCEQVTYSAGEGFFDRGFGHVHHAVAGPNGADFYAVYVLPPGSATHVTPAPVPEECASPPASDEDEDDEEGDEDDD